MFLGKSWIFSSKKITSGWVGTRSRVVWTDRREIPSHHLGTRSCRDIVGAFQRYSKILSVHFKGSDQDLSTGSHTQVNSNVSVHTTVSFYLPKKLLCPKNLWSTVNDIMTDEKLLIKIWPFNQIHCKAHHINFWKLTKSTHVELFLKGYKKIKNDPCVYTCNKQQLVFHPFLTL